MRNQMVTYSVSKWFKRPYGTRSVVYILYPPVNWGAIDEACLTARALARFLESLVFHRDGCCYNHDMLMKTRTLIRIFLLLIVAFSLMAVGQTAEEAGKTQQTQTAPQTSPQTQGTERTLASRLGDSSDTKLLILHADDLGMAHSVNDASMKAMDAGTISSGSIMVPCPWFPEIAYLRKSNPDADLGLHLDSDERVADVPLGTVLSKNLVPSFSIRKATLYPTEDVAAAHINPHEAEAEIRAQIERARANGIAPTHLDSHMRTLYQNQALCEAFLRVGRETRMPVMIAKEWFTDMKYLPSILKPEDPVVNDVISIGTDVKPSKWLTRIRPWSRESSRASLS